MTQQTKPFSLNEYLSLEQEDIHEWWLLHKLPYPGCPVSFRLQQSLVWICHKSIPDHLIERRLDHLRSVLGFVTFEGFKLSGQPQLMAVFHFPFKDKNLLVPLDPDPDIQTADFVLLAYLLKSTPIQG